MYDFYREEEVCSALELGRPIDRDVSTLNVLIAEVPSFGNIAREQSSYWHRRLRRKPSSIRVAFDEDFEEHNPDGVKEAIHSFLESLDRHRKDLVGFGIGEGELTLIAEHAIINDLSIKVILLIGMIEDAVIKSLHDQAM